MTATTSSGTDFAVMQPSETALLSKTQQFSPWLLHHTWNLLLIAQYQFALTKTAISLCAAHELTTIGDEE